jgi:hypothetical protein
MRSPRQMDLAARAQPSSNEMRVLPTAVSATGSAVMFRYWLRVFCVVLLLVDILGALVLVPFLIRPTQSVKISELVGDGSLVLDPQVSISTMQLMQEDLQKRVVTHRWLIVFFFFTSIVNAVSIALIAGQMWRESCTREGVPNQRII